MELKVGEVIKSVRSDLGWSMKKMADFLGIRKGYISKYESGKSQPRNKIEVMKKINTLGCEFKLSAQSGDVVISIPLFESNLTVTKK